MTAKFASIQTLRAVAAASVMLYHEGFVPVGYMGVDIFFVISGFIMGSIGSRENNTEFLKNRLIRVVPLYWLVTVAMCTVSLVPGLFSTFTFNFGSLMMSLFFVPHFDNTGHIWPLIVPGWTLNYEMFFYMMFFVGLTVGYPRVFTQCLLGVLVIMGFFVSSGSAIVQTYTSPLLLEFAAGVALSSYIPSRVRNGVTFASVSIIMSVLIFIVANFANIENNSDPSRVAWLGIPAVLLVVGALTMEQAGYWPRIKCIELIGDASYSLYLLHGIVIAFVHKFVYISIVLNHALALTLSIIVAIISYRFFEVPVARYLKRAFGSQSYKNNEHLRIPAHHAHAPGLPAKDV